MLSPSNLSPSLIRYCLPWPQRLPDDLTCVTAMACAGLQALHDGDVKAAQRQLESLETINRYSNLHAELQLRIHLASWDAATDDEGQRARLLEELRQTAGVEFGSFEAS